MKGYLLAVIAFLIAGVFFFLWRNKPDSTPMPPTFIEARLLDYSFVPVVDKIVKVYAVCPAGILKGSYVMGWTATANYTLDLSKAKVSQAPVPSPEATPDLQIDLPPLSLLREGDNIIGAEDHYWFPRPFEAGLRKSYATERLRANKIAIANALHRISTDTKLKEQAEGQVRSFVTGLLAQGSGKAPKITVRIADYTAKIENPEQPRTCKQQPLSGEIVPRELANPGTSDTAPVPVALSSFSAIDHGADVVAAGIWEAWIRSDRPVLSGAVRP